MSAHSAGMPPLLSELPHKLDRDALTCRAVIETPAGARAKYKFNDKIGAFELNKLLPASMSFPMNFGFVPSTIAGDGDPLDILVLNEVPLPMGCVAKVRLIGAIVAEQTQDGKTVRNDRLVARLEEGTRYSGVEGLNQLGEAFTDELERFFTTYNELRGRKFKVLSVEGAEKAAELVKDAAR
jgi:inorganic pyrophosphatase